MRGCFIQHNDFEIFPHCYVHPLYWWAASYLLPVDGHLGGFQFLGCFPFLAIRYKATRNIGVAKTYVDMYFHFHVEESCGSTEILQSPVEYLARGSWAHKTTSLSVAMAFTQRPLQTP